MRGIESAALSLCVEDLVGTWVGVRTEWPAPFEPAAAYMHFTADGRHFWEYPFLGNGREMWEFRYAITVDGLRVKSRKGTNQFDFDAWRERDLLVMISRGYVTWYRRLSANERPAFLQMFFEPL
ncbi:MAG TPA: hypothetical protein VG733_08810 [Chthoniobacteraceae bacterium]|nr:hypothetical protein [Chthoniobacteraceae bacterium]